MYTPLLPDKNTSNAPRLVRMLVLTALIVAAIIGLSFAGHENQAKEASVGLAEVENLEKAEEPEVIVGEPEKDPDVIVREPWKEPEVVVGEYGQLEKEAQIGEPGRIDEEVEVGTSKKPAAAVAPPAAKTAKTQVTTDKKQTSGKSGKGDVEKDDGSYNRKPDDMSVKDFICKTYLNYDEEKTPKGYSVADIKKCTKCAGGDCVQPFFDGNELTKDGFLDKGKQAQICGYKLIYTEEDKKGADDKKQAKGAAEGSKGKKQKGDRLFVARRERRQLWGYLQAFTDGVCNGWGYMRSWFWQWVVVVTITRPNTPINGAAKRNLRNTLISNANLGYSRRDDIQRVLVHTDANNQLVVSVSGGNRQMAMAWDAAKFNAQGATNVAAAWQKSLRVIFNDKYVAFPNTGGLNTFIGEVFAGNHGAIGAAGQPANGEQDAILAWLQSRRLYVHDRNYNNAEAFARGLLGEVRSIPTEAADKQLAPGNIRNNNIQTTIRLIMTEIKRVFGNTINNNPAFARRGRDAMLYSWQDNMRVMVQKFPANPTKKYIPLIFDLALDLKRLADAGVGEQAWYDNCKDGANLLAGDQSAARRNYDAAGNSYRNPNELSPWVLNARAQGYPIEAGPSATTAQVCCVMRFINHLNQVGGIAEPFNDQHFTDFGNAAWSHWQTEAYRSYSPVHTRWEVMDVVSYHLRLKNGQDPNGRQNVL